MAHESVKTLVQHGFSRTHGDDRPISELARRQHGVVARWQLMERGWTEEEIEWRMRTGRLHRLHAGVYAVGHKRASRLGRWMAAVLASGHDAMLSHHTELDVEPEAIASDLRRLLLGDR
jgi:hypothetical protein